MARTLRTSRSSIPMTRPCHDPLQAVRRASPSLGPVHVLVLAANESLIHFDWGRRHRRSSGSESSCIASPNAMQHEPCRFLSDPDGRCDLIAANPILAVHHHPDDGKPLIEADWRILHDGANLEREFLFRCFHGSDTRVRFLHVAHFVDPHRGQRTLPSSQRIATMNWRQFS